MVKKEMEREGGVVDRILQDLFISWSSSQR